MTDAELTRWQTLLVDCVPLPWSVKHSRHQGSDVYTVLDANGFWVADCGNDPIAAEWIAEARTALPTALDALVAARAEVERQGGWADTFETRYALASGERDAALAEIDRMRAVVEAAGCIRDAWESTEVDCGRCNRPSEDSARKMIAEADKDLADMLRTAHDDVARAIAAWLESRPWASINERDVVPTVRAIAGMVRAGAWRKP